ncbi:cytochrome P450 [Actinomadura rubrobrunea]|uniref:Cytochrome P450 n=1 Tax=Actinomadura rubrobrunea TaxID=115335 RepID=A0A9W6UW90_9ACTN|nr:cytochrome P450 [Actinomadura rubrobrunea]GLW66451.1 cytochrome P450 [Actinomadura rubrobrunea]
MTGHLSHDGPPDVRDLPPYARLYSPEFHADPEAAWQRLRERGRVAWVEIEPGVPAILVLDYYLILSICRNATGAWTRRTSTSRAWTEGWIRAGSETAAMIREWPNMLFAEGSEHERLRAPVVAALRTVDVRELQAYVEQSALELIGRLLPQGRAELISEYAVVLPLIAMSWLFGLDEIERWRLPELMKRIWDADGADQAAYDLARIMDVTVRRHQQGLAHGPLTTALTRQPGKLTHEEIVGTLVLMVGAGSQPAANLIANTVAEILTNTQLHLEVTSLALPADDVVHHTLWARPPITHYPPLVAKNNVSIDRVFIPRGTLALLGLGPAGHQIHQAHRSPYNRDYAALHNNRGYVAFGVGPHQCPARLHALVIAQTAVTTLLAELRDLHLADQLRWRPSPFARALDRLDVEFTPRPFPTLRPEGTHPSWHPRTVGLSPSNPTSTAASRANSSRGGRWFRLPFRGTSRHGR